MKLLFKSFLIMVILGIVFLTVITISCPQKPKLTGSMVIVSHVGEVTVAVRSVGEVVKYRIYYQNNTTQQTDIGITDKLDKILSQVTPFNGGSYDESEHTVTWKVTNVPTGESGYVELVAVVGDAQVIHNQAVVVDMREERKITTNSVEIQVCGLPKLGWIPFDRVSQPGEVPRPAMKDETTMGIMMNFDIPGMFVHEVEVDKVTYHRLSIPGYATLMDVGKPELPIVGQVIEVPYGVNFDIEIVKSKSIPLECYNVYPAQEPVVEQEPGEIEFALDKKVYLTDAYYPAILAEVTAEDIGVIRGHRVVFLKINPVQYNPVSREMEAYTQIEVRLKYDKPAQIEPVDNRVRSSAFEELLQASILNYKDANRFGVTEGGDTETEEHKEDGCEYLIITHDGFYNANDSNNAIVRLQNWKQRKGLRTRVVKIGDIGNTAADIRNYLQNTYDNWWPPPSYVLLVGDADLIVPDYQTDHTSIFHRVNVGTPNERATQIGTDLYYATLDGNDYFPDIIIGRISADTDVDVTTIVDKILDYEQNPSNNADFYNNTSLVRLFEDDNPSDGREDTNWVLIELAEELRDFLINENYDARRIYNFSGNFAQGPQRWENGQNLPVNLTFNGNPPFLWDGDDQDIIDVFNDGNFLISYRGHGGRAGWGNPDFDTWNFANLNNGNIAPEYPVIFGLTCQTGWFDDETDDNDLGTNTDCFAEEILRQNNGGAVAIIASARNSWGATNNESTKGMCDALWPGFDNAVPAGFLPRMGQINTYSKIYMARNIGGGNPRLITFEMSHLFGDPEMPVWIEEPAELHVDHPEGIGTTGEQDFVVKVTNKNSGDAVQNAVVTLTRDVTIVSAQQPNPGGVARFTLYSIGSGDLDITVTALNYRPYEGEIVVNTGGAVLNRLDPEDGMENQVIYVGGQNFSSGEDVDIYFGDQLEKTVTATGGDFGQSGIQDVDIKVPSPYDLGPVNILVHGKTSDRYAVDVFQVRTANPIDLYTYSQWDDTTWHLQPGGNLTWNNPEIQLYDSGGNSVASNNLNVTQIYTTKATIHNDTAFTAKNVSVRFKWADFGVGQRVWHEMEGSPVVLDVPPGETDAEVKWAPSETGHTCIVVEIYHIEDIKESNNSGQENCHVGTTASPAEVSFVVGNPTKEPAYVFLELRQIVPEGEELENLLWASWIRHPDPQLIPPGKALEAWVIIDPKWADVKPGRQAEFALTAYISGEVIGGVNFIIINDGGKL